jgi:hypothetical protein
MDAVKQALSDAFSDPALTSAIYGVIVLALLDVITGTARSISDKSFEWTALDVWVRTKVAGRVVPIIAVLLVGAFAPNLTVLGLSINILGATGVAAAATFAAAELASIVDNLRAPGENPVPKA